MCDGRAAGFKAAEGGMGAMDDLIFQDLRSERARRAVPDGFPALAEIPGGRYTRRDFFDLEMARVFRRSWVLAGHVSELPKAGSYKVFAKLPSAPILIVRGRDGQVRGFYNTCRHRGAPVVKDQAGRCNVLRCQYHSWAYDFDGRLVQVPDEHEFPNLDRAERGLIPVRCELLHGLIFVNQDDDAPALAETAGALAEEWTDLGLAAGQVDYRFSRRVSCNWKCGLDAFQEVYHINTLHPQTVGATLVHSVAAMSLLPHGHSRMCVQLKTVDIDDAPDGGWPDGEIYRRSSVAHTLWPNMVVPWGAGSGRFILFWPIGPGECEIEVLGVGPAWGEGPLPADREVANARFDGVLMEDIENLAAIQASLESGAFTGMMLGYQERRLYWAHEEIDRVIGVDAVPPDLRVPLVLSPFIETPEARPGHAAERGRA